MSYRNLKGGDRVRFLQPAGIGLKGQEWKERTATVQPLLVFEDHVVVNLGGKYGTPAVVDDSNYIGKA